MPRLPERIRVIENERVAEWISSTLIRWQGSRIAGVTQNRLPKYGIKWLQPKPRHHGLRITS